MTDKNPKQSKIEPSGKTNPMFDNKFEVVEVKSSKREITPPDLKLEVIVVKVRGQKGSPLVMHRFDNEPRGCVRNGVIAPSW